MKRLSRIILILSLAILTGCNSKAGSEEIATSEKVSTESNAVEMGFTKTGKMIGGLSVDESTDVFSHKDVIPLLTEDGQKLGLLKIKKITKLGIWDWNNTTAVKNGIRGSYAFTVELDYSSSVQTGESLMINCTPTFISEGEIIGEKCTVGWSGYPDSGQLFDKSPKQWIEFGVQPYVSELPANTILCLKFTDSADNEYKDVAIGADFINDVVAGPSILEVSDKAVIKSINGAKYNISFKNVFFEKQKINNGMDWFYSFDYRVKYSKKPKYDVDVSLFDSLDKYKLNTNFVIGLQSDKDPTVLYDTVPGTFRKIASDGDRYAEYVTAGTVFLYETQSGVVTDNRYVPLSTTITPEYVRLIVEFPEERVARTDEQMLDFSGRYTVFQIKIGQREMPTIKELEEKERQ